MTTPQLLENLRTVFPELKDFLHQDTLCRLLETIDLDQIESLYICETMANRELDAKRLRGLPESPGQLRLLCEDNWKASRPAA